jgi:hypothetical protein
VRPDHIPSACVSTSLPFAFLVCLCSGLALVGIPGTCIKTDMSHVSLHLYEMMHSTNS